MTEHASIIPIGWKNHGAYEAELIRRADARLASYPSGYGHDFGGPPPLTQRLADYGTYLRPPWLRRYAYRLKNRMRGSGRLSEYLCQEYRDAALPEGARSGRRSRSYCPNSDAGILNQPIRGPNSRRFPSLIFAGP